MRRLAMLWGGLSGKESNGTNFLNPTDSTFLTMKKLALIIVVHLWFSLDGLSQDVLDLFIPNPSYYSEERIDSKLWGLNKTKLVKKVIYEVQYTLGMDDVYKHSFQFNQRGLLMNYTETLDKKMREQHTFVYQFEDGTVYSTRETTSYRSSKKGENTYLIKYNSYLNPIKYHRDVYNEYISPREQEQFTCTSIDDIIKYNSRRQITEIKTYIANDQEKRLYSTQNYMYRDGGVLDSINYLNYALKVKEIDFGYALKYFYQDNVLTQIKVYNIEENNKIELRYKLKIHHSKKGMSAFTVNEQGLRDNHILIIFDKQGNWISYGDHKNDVYKTRKIKYW